LESAANLLNCFERGIEIHSGEGLAHVEAFAVAVEIAVVAASNWESGVSMPESIPLARALALELQPCVSWLVQKTIRLAVAEAIENQLNVWSWDIQSPSTPLRPSQR